MWIKIVKIIKNVAFVFFLGVFMYGGIYYLIQGDIESALIAVPWILFVLVVYFVGWKKIFSFIFMLFFWFMKASRNSDETTGQTKTTSVPQHKVNEQRYYCDYCGDDFNSIKDLTSNWCSHHPHGHRKGMHKLYEGNTKDSYSCKYCGDTFKSIRDLTHNWCSRHPHGHRKGYHSPAL